MWGSTRTLLSEVLAVTVTRGSIARLRTEPQPKDCAASDSTVMSACWTDAPCPSTQMATLETLRDSQGSFLLSLTLGSSCHCSNRLCSFETLALPSVSKVLRLCPVDSACQKPTPPPSVFALLPSTSPNSTSSVPENSEQMGEADISQTCRVLGLLLSPSCHSIINSLPFHPLRAQTPNLCDF